MHDADVDIVSSMAPRRMKNAEADIASSMPADLRGYRIVTLDVRKWPGLAHMFAEDEDVISVMFGGREAFKIRKVNEDSAVGNAGEIETLISVLAPSFPVFGSVDMILSLNESIRFRCRHGCPSVISTCGCIVLFHILHQATSFALLEGFVHYSVFDVDGERPRGGDCGGVDSKHIFLGINQNGGELIHGCSCCLVVRGSMGNN